MAVHVALLYSIVIGAGRRLVMTDLRALARELGYLRPRTVVATGNLVFEAEERDPRGVEARLEPAVAARFGRRIDVIVRPARDWPRLLDGNPFREPAEATPATVHARVQRVPLRNGVPAELERFRAEGERMAVVGGDLWLHLPHGAGRSRLAAAVTPHRAGAGTFRNWNTLRRLGEMLEA